MKEIWTTYLIWMKMNKPFINVLTRTHREAFFHVCRESVVNQTYPMVNHIVGSDTVCGYHSEYHHLYKDYRMPLYVPANHYHAPWNLYLNELQTLCVEGWVTYLDDDDMYTSVDALAELSDFMQDEDRMLIWKVAITPHWIVPNKSFGKQVTAGDFSGIGFAFHTKHLPVDWGIYSYGDYRVATQLLNKGLKPLWINKVLTRTQGGAHNGR